MKIVIFGPSTTGRLNSGNFGDFLLTSILNPHSSVCKTLEIHENDTKMVKIPWDSQVENQFFDFCVGDFLGSNYRSSNI